MMIKVYDVEKQKIISAAPVLKRGRHKVGSGSSVRVFTLDAAPEGFISSWERTGDFSLVRQMCKSLQCGIMDVKFKSVKILAVLICFF